MFLITGANGQLGLCLKDLLGQNGAIYTDAADYRHAYLCAAFGPGHFAVADPAG